MAHPCKCCCYQELKVFDSNGTSLGRFTEDCYFCHSLPQYTIFDESDNPTYKVHPPVCFGCWYVIITYYYYHYYLLLLLLFYYYYLLFLIIITYYYYYYFIIISVQICAEGLCNCRVPFYLYDISQTGDHDDSNVRGKIVKVWAGLLNTFIDVHKFEVEFPINADANEKARICGATFLINEIYFHEEKKQNT